MQRQSLGSPSSKLVKDEQVCCEEEEEGREGVKSKLKGTSAYIHLIPMLTLLCFLILYLSSHDPSLNDLGHLDTFFNPPAEFVDIKKGDIMGIRSLKNIKQEPRLHRKFAHF